MAFTEALKEVTFDGYKGQLRYHAKADGPGQDQTNNVLVNLSALAPAPKHVTVERVQAMVNGAFEVILKFDNQEIIRLAGQSDRSNPFDYIFTGGPNKGVANTVPGGTGNILYSTSGIAAGNELTLIVDFHKKN